MSRAGIVIEQCLKALPKLWGIRRFLFDERSLTVPGNFNRGRKQLLQAIPVERVGVGLTGLHVCSLEANSTPGGDYTAPYAPAGRKFRDFRLFRC